MKVKFLIVSGVLVFSCLGISGLFALGKKGNKMGDKIIVNIKIDAEEKVISPYIFGINDRADL